MATAPRRKNPIPNRRRAEDEGDGDVHTGLEAARDSPAGTAMASNDRAAAADGDTIKRQDASSTPGANHGASNGSAKPSIKGQSKPNTALTPPSTYPAEAGKSSESQTPQAQTQPNAVEPSPPKSPSGPVIVSSASAMNPAANDADGRCRNQDDEYKRRRDQDPAFVPNRGAFFMHDSRQSGGPPGNTVRSFGRGRGRGGRAGGYAGSNYGRAKCVDPIYPSCHPYTYHHSPMYQPADPTTSSAWTHDMHDTSTHTYQSRRPRHVQQHEGPPNGDGYIPTCKESDTPINRTLSTEKHIGNAQVRVYLPNMTDAIVFPGLHIKQYTKLPDHRPPLRRDKPVRISLPERSPRYIYPAPDRSFTFIPRALRPNQQRVRGKPRSGFGSVSGFSRRTSIFGGSYYGSMYSPSVNMSRRSSIVNERDFMFSPTGSVVSRAPHPVDNRPIVRLPPGPRMDMMMPDIGAQFATALPVQEMPPPAKMEPPPTEGQPVPVLPMYQPRPQKNISVAHIESPTMSQGQFQQQAFHQQVPVQVSTGYQREGHSRRQSQSHHVSSTPLSHIPERTGHAGSFSHGYAQQGYYQGQQVPQQMPNQQGYYYQGYPSTGMNAPASGYPSNATSPNYAMQGQMDQSQGGLANNLVAQEVNGMVYYFDPSQMQPPTTYPPYPATQNYPTSGMGMHGMMTPSPDAFYYTQPGMMYYPQ